MGNKISLIIGFFVSFVIFVFYGDLISIQSSYAHLDALATQVGLSLTSLGGSTSQNIEYINDSIINNTNISFKIIVSSVKEGEFVKYSLHRIYKPIILSNESMNIMVERVAIVGIYNIEI